MRVMAEAQGRGASANAVDSAALASDGLRSQLRSETERRLGEVRAAIAAIDEGLTDMYASLGDSQRVGPGVLALGMLALVVGVVSGGVLIPTIELMFGGVILEMWGENATLACVVLAICFGMVTPLLGIGSACLRVGPWKIVCLGVVELACFALLAWGRLRVLAPVVPDATDAEVVADFGGAVGRTCMMFSVEALLIASIVAASVAISGALQRADVRRGMDERIERVRTRLLAAQQENARLEAVRADDLAHATLRDIAIARVEKVRDLVYATMRQGAEEQVQGNFDALQNAPRAALGEARVAPKSADIRPAIPAAAN